MKTCPECHQETPDRNFCVRCGAHLKEGDGTTRGYAAAPHEHRFLPSIVSSLFPHLPRSDMRHYRWAMGIGTLIVIGLGVAGLFPVALAAAALLIPLLTALYLHDVNVYEDEPWLVIGFTLVWGAVCGVGIALLAHALEPSSLNQLASGHHASGWITIVLLPTLELVLAVAGPALVLLPHRRFNDVLDGVTFGAATAAALSATEVIVDGYRLFQHGLRPGGAVLPWIWRLLTLRITLPILAMAATGAACGALWLRYRGSPASRNALGPLGHPLVAFAARAGLLMLAAAGQRLLPVGAWLALLVVLAVIALVWLRLMLQFGLRQESAGLAIGPDVDCPNCGARTQQHSYCAECGVSLRALPKRELWPPPAPETAAAPAPQPVPVAPPRPTRLLARHRIAAFAVFIAATGLAAIVVAAIAPHKLEAQCKPARPCGAPPTLAQPLHSESTWRSSGLGFALEYSPQQWKIGQQGANGVELRSTVAPIDLVIQGSAGATSASALIDAKVNSLKSNILGLTQDTSTADQILGPEVGYVYGAGGAFAGAIDSPQGVTDQVFVTVQSAISKSLGIVVTTLTNENSAKLRREEYGLADEVLNTVTWPGQGT